MGQLRLKDRVVAINYQLLKESAVWSLTAIGRAVDSSIRQHPSAAIGEFAYGGDVWRGISAGPDGRIVPGLITENPPLNR
jgi:hypothetical protein